MILRDATASDLPAILLLERRCFGAHGWSEAMFRAELGRPGGSFLVADGAGGISGLAVGWAAAGTSEVLDVAVHPDARRQGLGRRLLAALEERAWAAGAVESCLEVRASNAGAFALYRSAGYEQVGVRRAYYPDGEDALILIRLFPASALSPPGTPGGS